MRVVLAISAVLVLVTLQAQAQKSDSSKRNHPNAAADQRGSDSLPIAVKLLNTGRSDREAAEEAAAVEENRQIAAATLRWIKITGLATAAYAAVTVGLWLATVRLASDGRESSERHSAPRSPFATSRYMKSLRQELPRTSFDGRLSRDLKTLE